MNLPIFTEPIDRKPVNPQLLQLAVAIIALDSFVEMSDDFDELGDMFPILMGQECDLAKIIGKITDKTDTMRRNKFHSTPAQIERRVASWADRQMAEWQRKAARS